MISYKNADYYNNLKGKIALQKEMALFLQKSITIMNNRFF